MHVSNGNILLKCHFHRPFQVSVQYFAAIHSVCSHDRPLAPLSVFCQTADKQQPSPLYVQILATQISGQFLCSLARNMQHAVTHISNVIRYLFWVKGRGG